MGVALVASCALLAPAVAHADPPSRPTEPTPAEPDRAVWSAPTPSPYGPVVAPYHGPGMRTAGLVLTGIAVGEVILGSILLGVGANVTSTCSPGTSCANTTDNTAGAALLGTSAVLAAIGIPLWIIGSRPYRADLTAKAAPPVRIVPSATGLRLAF